MNIFPKTSRQRLGIQTCADKEQILRYNHDFNGVSAPPHTASLAFPLITMPQLNLYDKMRKSRRKCWRKYRLSCPSRLEPFPFMQSTIRDFVWGTLYNLIMSPVFSLSPPQRRHNFQAIVGGVQPLSLFLFKHLPHSFSYLL